MQLEFLAPPQYAWTNDPDAFGRWINEVAAREGMSNPSASYRGALKIIDLGQINETDETTLRGILAEYAEGGATFLTFLLLQKIVAWYADGYPKNSAGLIDQRQASSTRDTTPWRLARDLSACMGYRVAIRD